MGRGWLGVRSRELQSLQRYWDTLKFMSDSIDGLSLLAPFLVLLGDGA
jgi:hypothetical protein